MKLSKHQLDKLLAQAAEDVEQLLKNEPEEGKSLAKADEGEETPAEKKPEGSSVEPPKPEEGETSATGKDEEAGQEQGEPAGQEEAATPEVLQEEYSKLPPEELKMHFIACKAALMAVMGSEEKAPTQEVAGGEQAAQGMPPAGEEDMKVAKSEKNIALSSDIIARLEKAEKGVAEVEKLRKSIAEKDATIAALEEHIGKVASSFQKLVTHQQVMRKSVAGVNFVQKPGTESVSSNAVDVSKLSKAEVVEKLKGVTASDKLSKSDREVINRFVVGTDVPVESVAKFIQ